MTSSRLRRALSITVLFLGSLCFAEPAHEFAVSDSCASARSAPRPPALVDGTALGALDREMLDRLFSGARAFPGLDEVPGIFGTTPNAVVRYSSPPARFARPTRPPPPARRGEGIELESMKTLARSLHTDDPHLRRLFSNAVLDAGKQASYAPDGTVYVRTGDIAAEFLRDSSAQVRPYLFVAKTDPAAADFLKAVILRQARSLLRDPYANAFGEDYGVWEEKFELDSLAYPIILAWTDWQVTKDKSVFAPDVVAGLEKALATMEVEQDHDKSPHNSRFSWPWLVAAQLTFNSYKYTGMIWTGFRPSDDACTYNYLIPSEMLAVVALEKLEQIEREALGNQDAARRAHKLAGDVRRGIQEFGVVDHPKYGRIYAYEVDGLGHALLMDDANIPSLLSSPDLGYGSASDPVYQNTRRFALSKDNPYYYSGSKASGVGSPHMTQWKYWPFAKPWVWPLALLSQGFTSTSASEKDRVLRQLLASDPGDDRLHESFDPNDPRNYTRPNFGWPNSLFAELVLRQKQGRSLPR